MYIWIMTYLITSAKVACMAAATTYYWSSAPMDPDQPLIEEEEGVAEVGYAIWITHFYHSGSLAYGSFVISFI